ncbi:MAG: hypothetical protein WAM77_30055, partial [Xanthobacteraceae bacterium]
MRKNVTYEKSVIYGTALAKHTPASSMASDVIYGRSVIASEAKQSRETPGRAIKFEPPSWIASSLR